MNFFIIFFFFFLYCTSADYFSPRSYKRLLLEYQTENINDEIVDIEVSLSERTVYVLSKYNGIYIFNSSSLEDQTNGLASIKMITGNLLSDLQILKIKAVRQDILMILAIESSNQAKSIMFYNNSDLSNLNLLWRNAQILNSSFDFLDWEYGESNRLLYVLGKQCGFVYYLDNNYSLKLRNAFPSYDFFEMHLSNDDNILFFVNSSTFTIGNFTNSESIQIYEMLVTYYVTQTFREEMISLLPINIVSSSITANRNTIHYFNCSSSKGIVSYIDVSNLTNIISYSKIDNNVIDKLSYSCLKNEKAFVYSYSWDTALINFDDSTAVLFQYQVQNYLIFDSKILVPSQKLIKVFDFILAQSYYSEKLILIKMGSFDQNVLPTAIINEISNLNGFEYKNVYMLTLLAESVCFILYEGGDYELYLISEAFGGDFSNPAHFQICSPSDSTFTFNYAFSYKFPTVDPYDAQDVQLVAVVTFYDDYRFEIIDGSSASVTMQVKLPDYPHKITSPYITVLYLIPYLTSNVANILAINYEDSSNSVYYTTNIGIPANTQVVSVTACRWCVDLTNCIKYSDYLFYKTEKEPYIYIHEIDPNNFTNLTRIAKIFIDGEIVDMKTSRDCNALYSAGDSLKVINITEKSNPFIIKEIKMTNILEIQIVKRVFLYIFADKITLKYSISDLYNPKFLYNYFHPFRHKRSNKIYGAVVTQTDNMDITVIYRSFYDESLPNVAKFLTPISLILERVCPYYIFLLNYETVLKVGVSTTYKYYVSYVAVDDAYYTASGRTVHYSVTGVINSITFVKDIEMNMVSLPSWITFDLNKQEIYITPDKSYLGSAISLCFTMNAIVDTDYQKTKKELKYTNNKIKTFTQIVEFPTVFSSLNIEATSQKNSNTSKALQINSASDSIIVNLEITNNTYSCLFINDVFAGIFLSLSNQNKKVVASGIKSATNYFLKLLRFRCDNMSNEFNQSIFVSVDDGINIAQEYSNFTLSYFKPNNIPELKLSLQEQFNNFKITMIPTMEFSFKFAVNSFEDQDNDKRTYSLQNNIKNAILPDWIKFDEQTFSIYGIPPISADGNYFSLKVVVSDGYNDNYDTLNFRIFHSPPQNIIPFENQTVKIGNAFSYQFDDNYFQKTDLFPNVLSYSALIYNITDINDKKIIDDPNFWLTFSPLTKKFSGVPNSIKYSDNKYKIEIIASDGFKTCNSEFYLAIESSLKIMSNGTAGSLNFDSSSNDSVISITFKSNGAKILMPASSIKNLDLKINSDANLTEVQIIGLSSEVNFVLKDLEYRISKPKNNNSRILSDEEFLNIEMTDSFGQKTEGKFNLSFINLDNSRPIINTSYVTDITYLIEIGTLPRISLNSELFTKNPKLNYSYHYSVKDKNKDSRDFLLFSQSSFQFYTTKIIDESLYGYYFVDLTIVDEYGDNCTYTFSMTIDYTTLDKFIAALRWIGTIAGPIISVLASIKYYFIIYNITRTNDLKVQDKIVFINEKFKWKFPLIGNEYHIAVKIKKKFVGLIKKKKSSLFTDFINENKTKLKLLNEYSEFWVILNEIKEYKYLPDETSQTVDCIIHDMIQADLIKSNPFLYKLMDLLKNQTLLHLNLKKYDKNQWYNFYFEEILDKNMKESKYYFMKGKFYDFEKYVLCNTKIFEQNFNLMLNENEKKLKKKETKNWKLNESKHFLLIGLHCLRRGLLYRHNPILLFLNQVLSLVGLRLFSYRLGDCLLAQSENIDSIICVTKKSLRQKDRPTESQEFFSLKSKSIPPWLDFEQKKGLLIITGQAPKYAKDIEYQISIKDKKKLNVLQFLIIVKSKLEMSKTSRRSLFQTFTNESPQTPLTHSINTELDPFVKNQAGSIMSGSKVIGKLEIDSDILVGKKEESKQKKSSIFKKTDCTKSNEKQSQMKQKKEPESQELEIPEENT